MEMNKMGKDKQSKANKEREELVSDLKRVQADFINYKNRMDEEKRSWLKFANQGLIEKLIPVIDNFQRAKEHMPKELEDNDYVKGLMAVQKQLEQLLKDEGVERIETAGEFDPKFHEAVFYEESDKEEGSIIEVLEDGYRIGDTVIKAAKVKVSKGKEKEEK